MNNNQITIIINMVLVGTSNLIPIPLLDDTAVAFFNKRLVSDLAKKHGISLNANEVSLLAAGQQEGCLGLFITRITVFPLKKLAKMALKEGLLIFEIGHTVDLMTQTYYRGFMLDYLFSEKLYQPGDLKAAQTINLIINQLQKKSNSKLLKNLFKKTLINSKELFKGAINSLLPIIKRKLKRNTQPLIDQLKRFLMINFKLKWLKQPEMLIPENDVELEEVEHIPVIADLVVLFGKDLASLPQEHFTQLKSDLRQVIINNTPDLI